MTADAAFICCEHSKNSFVSLFGDVIQFWGGTHSANEFCKRITSVSQYAAFGYLNRALAVYESTSIRMIATISAAFSLISKSLPVCVLIRTWSALHFSSLSSTTDALPRHMILPYFALYRHGVSSVIKLSSRSITAKTRLFRVMQSNLCPTFAQWAYSVSRPSACSTCP